MVNKSSLAVSVEWSLKQIGRPIRGPYTFQFPVLFFLHVILFTQIIIRQILPWKNVNSRILSLEEFNVVAFVIVCFYELSVSRNKINSLLNLFDESTLHKYLPQSDKQKEMKKEYDVNVMTTVKMLTFFCVLYAVGNVLPCIFGLYMINFKDTDAISDDDIPTSFKCWYPFSIKENINYIVAISPQVICRYFSGHIYLIWFVAVFGQLQTISMQVKMLTSYVAEIDERLGVESNKHLLNIYVSHLIRHHVLIIKAVKEFNRCSNVYLLAINQVQIFEFCIALYCFLEVTDLSFKVRYVLISFSLTCLMYIMANQGQQLTDEGENFYVNLLNTTWYAKPMAFKKSLLTMITVSRRPLEVKPLGLFVLNKRNITTVLQGGYSYLNLMKNAKNVK